MFLLINNRPPSNTDPTRKEKSGFWPAEQVVRPRLRHRRVPLRRTRPGRPEDVSRRCDPVVRRGIGRRTALVHVGCARRLGVGRQPRDGLFRERPTDRQDSTSRSSATRVAARRRCGPGRRTSGSRWSSRTIRVKGARRSAAAISARRLSGSTPPFPHWFSRRLQDIQSPRGGVAGRSTPAPGARRPAGALCRQCRRGSLGRSARRIPLAGRVVAGVRVVGRPTDSALPTCLPLDTALDHWPPRLSRAHRRAQSDAI